VLAAQGHAVEICDPDRFCLSGFSRFPARFHRCPGLRDDPAGYLAFVEDLLKRRHFDVLLPIHEQGLLFARVAECLTPLTGIALPSYASYRTAHSKTGFGRVLAELGLPQPMTTMLKLRDDLQAAVRFPCVLKAPIGTASRGTWVLRGPADLAAVLPRLSGTRELLLQDFIAGTVEHAQAVFCRGDLVGFHAYAQVAVGAGGGDAVKESVSRPGVRADLARIGAHLAWHGALSVDYIRSPGDGAPVYIDCNPRLVEPVNAALAGADLVGALLAVSLGERPAPIAEGRAGVRTHLGLQALLGCALAGGTRGDIARLGYDLALHRGAFAGSVEELTPVRRDWPSAIPLGVAALATIAAPSLADRLQRSGWGAHLLSEATVAAIDRGFG
jgi:predicted ATP-grasp superfamily ATP-dependent carboligase